jgi:glycine/D-amino acid oxidase-like deaminating enzyme
VARGSCVSLTSRGAYVPLLRRAYEGWHELAQESGRDLLRLCGGIYIGDPESPVFTGSLASARVHGLEHEVLDAAEIAARFPTMRPPEHALGLYEANAGYVRPEETVLANVDLARRDGADLRFSEPATHWTPTSGGGVEVVTSRGRYGADRLVLAPGAWVSTLLPPPVPIAIERQVFYWFEPDFTPEVPYEAYAKGHPVYLEETDGNGELYGFPMVDGPAGGLKLAFYRQNHGVTTTPQTIDRMSTPTRSRRWCSAPASSSPTSADAWCRPRPACTPRRPMTRSCSARSAALPRWCWPVASPATGSSSCRWWVRSSPTSSRPGRLRTTSRCSRSLGPPSQARE